MQQNVVCNKTCYATKSGMQQNVVLPPRAHRKYSNHDRKVFLKLLQEAIVQFPIDRRNKKLK
jgi:hypothetical protein